MLEKNSFRIVLFSNVYSIFDLQFIIKDVFLDRRKLVYGERTWSKEH